MDGIIKKAVKEFLQKRDGDYSLFFKDLSNGKVFVFNENKLLPAASTIKIPILIEFFRQLEADKIDSQEQLVADEVERVGGAGVLHELRKDIAISLQDLALIMITLSDNTSTNLLIDRLGIDNINNLLDKLGLETCLQRKMMDFEARKAGKENLTTAFEMGKLMEKIYLNNIPGLTAKSCNKIIEIMSKQVIRDKMSFFLPEDEWGQVASKTGTLDGIEHDVSLFDLDEGSYILVMMSSNLPTNAYGNLTIARTARLIYKNHKNIEISVEEELTSDY